MESQRYRVVLTGDLQPGYSLEAAVSHLAEVFQTPESSLRSIFDGTERPIDQTFSAEDALELQAKLDRVGVRSRIDRGSSVNVELKLRSGAVAPAPEKTPPVSSPSPDRTNQAGMMRCPACGHRQLVSNQCESCGIFFSAYNRNPEEEMRRAASLKAEHANQQHAADASASPRSTVSPQADWGNEWVDNEDEVELGEQHYLALFFGPPPQHYLDVCSRYLSGPRTRFRLGWNWGAFFSPFVWSLYRKMWGWSLVIFVTEILLPVLLIVLGSYKEGSSQLVSVGYAVLLANRLFWPALANYLYCRFARNTLKRMHMLSPNYATEIDIATAGGVSSSSVFAGLAVATVMSVFVWSVVDSMHESNHSAQQQRILETAEGVFSARTPVSADRPNIPAQGAEQPPENKWVSTRRILRSLAQNVNAWLAERPGTEPSQVSLFQLQEDLSLQSQAFLDAWNGEVQYIPDNEGYRLISAGPDRLFGTVDDIQFRRVLDQ